MAKKLKVWNGASWEDVTFAITPPTTNVTNEFSTNQVIDASTSVAALRITQRGSGEALRVEDSSNPDSSPFVIDASGQVYVGSVNSASKIPTTRQYLNVGGTSGPGVLQLADPSNAGSLDGLIEFHDLQNTSNSAGTRNAYIAGWVEGTTTANNRGGMLSFATKQDGVSDAAQPRMTITNTGLVGIGTTAPKLKLHTTGLSSSSMPSLGTASGSLYVTNTDVNYGLLVGVNSSSGAVWLQSQRTDATATAYNILLNPSGGNVGIGISDPVFKLQTYNELTSATVGAQALVFQAQIANGNQDFLKLYSERTASGGASWGTQDWILRRHVDASPMGGFRWAASEWNPIAFYGAPNDRSVRTTYISTGTPSGGNDGDMWATYV